MSKNLIKIVRESCDNVTNQGAIIKWVERGRFFVKRYCSVKVGRKGETLKYEQESAIAKTLKEALKIYGSYLPKKAG
jgi:DNA-binding transcriptional regulator of glucitol operon